MLQSVTNYQSRMYDERRCIVCVLMQREYYTMETNLLIFLHVGDHIVIKCDFVSESLRCIKAEACVHIVSFLSVVLLQFASPVPSAFCISLFH